MLEVSAHPSFEFFTGLIGYDVDSVVNKPRPTPVAPRDQPIAGGDDPAGRFRDAVPPSM